MDGGGRDTDDEEADNLADDSRAPSRAEHLGLQVPL